MSRGVRRRVAIGLRAVAAAMALVTMDADAESPAVAESHDVVAITHALRAHLRILPRPPRLCFRLPAQGRQAILVVQRPNAVARGRALLRAAGVVGDVEVVGRTAYERRMEDLSRAIEAESQAAVGATVHASAEAMVGGIECIKASIEIGVKGTVSEATLSWARSEIQRYGSDRVTYRYTPVGVVLASDGRDLQRRQSDAKGRVEVVQPCC